MSVIKKRLFCFYASAVLCYHSRTGCSSKKKISGPAESLRARFWVRLDPLYQNMSRSGLYATAELNRYSLAERRDANEVPEILVRFVSPQAHADRPLVHFAFLLHKA